MEHTDTASETAPVLEKKKNSKKNFTSFSPPVSGCSPLLWQQTLKEKPAEVLYSEVLTTAKKSSSDKEITASTNQSGAGAQRIRLPITAFTSNRENYRDS